MKFVYLQFILVIIFLIIIYRSQLKTVLKINEEENITFRNFDNPTSCATYRQNCQELFKRLRYTGEKYKFKPAIREIPVELYDAFTKDGFMNLTRYWYFSNIFQDAFSHDKTKKSAAPTDKFNMYREMVKNSQPMNNGDTGFQKRLTKYRKDIEDRTFVIIGTIAPWVEAIAYELNASLITTLDYTRKYWSDPKMEWYHVNDYLEEMMDKKLIERHDNAATFSSIEHSGLGRFGDPLSPNGDIDVMKQVHCMLKQDGLFFLGDLPNNPVEVGELFFNAHRVYGTKRLALLFEGWEVLEQDKNEFVLKKRGGC